MNLRLTEWEAECTVDALEEFLADRNWRNDPEARAAVRRVLRKLEAAKRAEVG
jgi:hypothetical protein